MPLPYDLCARLQNAVRARHARISVPHTTQNLAILSILLRAGFLTNITRGTVEAPSPEKFLNAGEVQRRIWADLKYRNDRPVLENMHLVSKPSKRVFMEPGEIRRLCTGRSVNTVKPLGMGEIAVVRTHHKWKELDWFEAREVLHRRLRAEVICRAS
jgi:ribosomal protein S8